jgi:hypothetical protein
MSWRVTSLTVKNLWHQMVLEGSYDSGLKTKIKNSWFDEQSHWRTLPVVNHA